MRLLRFSLLTGLCLVAVAACSRNSEVPSLMNIQARQSSPDEFSILPTGPLQAPERFDSLPTPTPGGTNLVDPDPRADVAVALGGRVGAVRTAGVPAADAGLVQYAGRGGVSGDIRETLAAEDEDLRRDGRGLLLERLFNSNVYRRAYRNQILDPQAELGRWRATGVRTPAAPPAAER